MSPIACGSRWFARVYFRRVPAATTLLRWAQTIQPLTLHLLNDRAAQLAAQARVTRARKLRVDGTVVETTIHHPTDSGLLGDGVRVLTRLIKRAQPLVGAVLAGTRDALRDRTRTMRRSLGRRMALRRPSEAEVKRLEQELAAAEAETPPDPMRIAELRSRLEHKQRLRRTIAYIDPIDLAYNRFDRVPKPTTQAVMFCLMDASASMTEPLKDLAKRFFMLLHVFLTRYYREVHIVFIRHTSTAAEVDEETFFRGTETGGTVISTALEEMLKVMRDRYSPADWNIYAAQASDGDNFHDDMPRCLELLNEQLLPVCQYFAYIETAHGERFNDSVETPVWHGYSEVAQRRRNFAMRRVASPEDIIPVFHELFSADAAAA